MGAVVQEGNRDGLELRDVGLHLYLEPLGERLGGVAGEGRHIVLK